MAAPLPGNCAIVFGRCVSAVAGAALPPALGPKTRSLPVDDGAREERDQRIPPFGGGRAWRTCSRPKRRRGRRETADEGTGSANGETAASRDQPWPRRRPASAQTRRRRARGPRDVRQRPRFAEVPRAMRRVIGAPRGHCGPSTGPSTTTRRSAASARARGAAHREPRPRPRSTPRTALPRCYRPRPRLPGGRPRKATPPVGLASPRPGPPPQKRRIWRGGPGRRPRIDARCRKTKGIHVALPRRSRGPRERTGATRPLPAHGIRASCVGIRSSTRRGAI